MQQLEAFSPQKHCTLLNTIQSNLNYIFLKTSLKIVFFQIELNPKVTSWTQSCSFLCKTMKMACHGPLQNVSCFSRLAHNFVTPWLVPHPSRNPWCLRQGQPGAATSWESMSSGIDKFLYNEMQYTGHKKCWWDLI